MAQKINFESVKDESLVKVLKSMDTEIDALRTLANELRTDHATTKVVIDALTAAVQGDCIVTSPALAIGSTTTHAANIGFNYIINGTLYYKAAVAAGTALGNDEVPQNKYGAVALDIGADGTVDAIEAAANATGYTSAALAIAGIPAAAADHVRMGTVTAIKTDGDFTFGSTALSAVNSTVVYTNNTGLFALITGTGPATLSAAAVTEQTETPK